MTTKIKSQSYIDVTRPRASSTLQEEKFKQLSKHDLTQIDIIDTPEILDIKSREISSLEESNQFWVNSVVDDSSLGRFQISDCISPSQQNFKLPSVENATRKSSYGNNTDSFVLNENKFNESLFKQAQKTCESQNDVKQIVSQFDQKGPPSVAI